MQVGRTLLHSLDVISLLESVQLEVRALRSRAHGTPRAGTPGGVFTAGRELLEIDQVLLRKGFEKSPVEELFGRHLLNTAAGSQDLGGIRVDSRRRLQATPLSIGHGAFAVVERFKEVDLIQNG